MNPAPGILVDFQPCVAWHGASRLLAASIAAGLLAWCWAHWTSGSEVDRFAFVLTISCIGWAGAYRLASASQSPRGRLVWNCQDWRWLPGDSNAGSLSLRNESAPRWATPQAGTAVIALDLGPWILIAFRPREAPRRTVWLPLRRASAGAQWQGLQCALRQPDAGLSQPGHTSA